MEPLLSPSDFAPPFSDHTWDSIDRLIRAVREHLGMDVGFVSEFVDNDRLMRSVTAKQPIGFCRGSVIPLAEGYCGHVVAGRLPQLIPDTGANTFARSLPETSSIPIGAHLSAPIFLEDGSVFGTFCCFSHSPQPTLDASHLNLLRTFASMIAAQMSAERAANRLRQEQAERILAALRNDDPQIVFQPIVRVADLSIVGVEALARFSTDRTRGPDKWFADAHAIGLGPALELRAAQKALAEAEALPYPFTVNINISPDTLTSQNVVSALERFDPRRIVVEITEHVPIADYDPVLSAIKALRSAGMRIAIDDAGAGYSSLRHVLTIVPDIIKFDISLTRDIDRDPMRQAMVAALAEFARRTGTKVVAEGVETADELNTLRDLGIEKAQGYRFGRPKPWLDVVADLSIQQLKSSRCPGMSLAEDQSTSGEGLKGPKIKAAEG